MSWNLQTTCFLHILLKNCIGRSNSRGHQICYSVEVGIYNPLRVYEPCSNTLPSTLFREMLHLAYITIGVGNRIATKI